MSYNLYLLLVDLMVVDYHVYVSWVGRPNVGGFLEHTNILLSKLFMGMYAKHGVDMVRWRFSPR